MPLEPVPYQPEIKNQAPGIAIIGAGGIVNDAHMPAYRKAGFNIVGIADQSRDAVQKTAQRWNIPFATVDPLELIRRADVQVVDLAIPDQGRLEIVQAAAARGLHLLIQKPLAAEMTAAREMVSIADRAKVKLAVNQNARWCPQYRAAALHCHRGDIGKVFHVVHDLRDVTDTAAWALSSWASKEPRFQILYWSIHYVDYIRFLMREEPTQVYARITRKPGQNFVGEISDLIVMEFASGATALLIDHNASWPHRHDPSMRFQIEGTEGLIEGQINDPAWIQVRTSKEPEAVWRPRLEGVWYPQGFIGAMADLLNAIAEDREPAVSGRDHLKTLAILAAAYRSAEEKRAIDPATLL
jgi:predicted dehydrogenase